MHISALNCTDLATTLRISEINNRSCQEVKVEGPSEVDSKVEDFGFESSFIVIQWTMQQANTTG
ncbi:unnamed protein product [Clonostachys byssicola]|uniref:Uncharacterized protein n=1 Tax=Clonostachys byssicola TaxID=160290 RepID=A0A9N9Y6G3_9HYPO|nr:unnamed protein product [Clonostachys byssicola]